MTQYKLRPTNHSITWIVAIIIAVGTFFYLIVQSISTENFIIYLLTVFNLGTITIIFSAFIERRLRYLVVDADGVKLRNNETKAIIEHSEIDELFYVVQIDETEKRKVEKPYEYQIISGNNRYIIDLTSFENQLIVKVNSLLQSKLGERYRIEERYVRKTSQKEKNSRRQRDDDEFIKLDTVGS